MTTILTVCVAQAAAQAAPSPTVTSGGGSWGEGRRNGEVERKISRKRKGESGHAVGKEEASSHSGAPGFTHGLASWGSWGGSTEQQGPPPAAESGESEPRQPQRLPGLQREQLAALFLLQGTLLAFLVSESLRSLSVSGSSAGS